MVLDAAEQQRAAIRQQRGPGLNVVLIGYGQSAAVRIDLWA